jgi:glycerophosphoryl diester phosphodiesterase
MFVTDAKEDNVRVMRWIAENYPDLREHFIVQIYALEEYEPIRALGYENIILTMYKIPWEEYHDLETLSAFIRDTRILAITMAADENVRDVFDALVATGIPVYVHTLDEPEEQARWLADGAYGIYTNYGDMRAE